MSFQHGGSYWNAMEHTENTNGGENRNKIKEQIATEQKKKL
jgi:hypothetical protein